MYEEVITALRMGAMCEGLLSILFLVLFPLLTTAVVHKSSFLSYTCILAGGTGINLTPPPLSIMRYAN